MVFVRETVMDEWQRCGHPARGAAACQMPSGYARQEAAFGEPD